jgi:3',5'-cyclic AMP phosphodiesterase CpdA
MRRDCIVMAACAALAGLLSSCASSKAPLASSSPVAGAPVYPNVSFIHCSDIHLFDPGLGTSGAAFQRYLDSDRKLLAESEAILEAATQEIVAADVDFVIVSGDLTKDGEKIDHELLARYLRRIEDSGKAVYVIPGNHDVENPDAKRYDGDASYPVDSVTPEEFADIYSDFGYSEAIERDPASLSYVAEPKPGLWLLALSSVEYGKNAALGYPVTGGSFSAASLAWIESALTKARDLGDAVIVMEHHGVVEHWKGQHRYHPDYLVKNYDKVAALFARYDARLVFTGHYHANDIALKRYGSKYVYDVETGSFVSYPSPYRVITIASNTAEMHIRKIENVAGFGRDFPAHSEEFTAKGINLMAYKTIRSYKVNEKDSRDIADQVTRAFMAHYRGDERPAAGQKTPDATGVGLPGRVVLANLGYVIDGLWHDGEPLADCDITIDLADGSYR